MSEALGWREVDQATGSGVRVLLLDSGVRTDHEALEGAAIRSWRVDGDEVVEDPKGGDMFGHGTAVASILHAHAPAAALDSLKVFSFGKRGLGARTRQALLGLRWGVEQGYHVINCSFVTERRSMLSEFKLLVDRAFRENVLLVAASDNETPDRACYPCDFPTVLGTTYARLDGLVIRRRAGRMIEFAAPGERIRVAWGDGRYRLATGASYAAPHLSALAARIRELRPGWNACQVKAALYGLAS